MNKTIPLSVPEKLLEEIQETARITHLSVQDVFRQSAVIAAPVLRETRRSAERPRRLSVWDALKSGTGLELKTINVPGKTGKISL